MKKQSRMILTDEDKKLKDELHALGAKLQGNAEASEKSFLSTLEKEYERAEEGSFWMRILGMARRPLVFMSVALGVLIILVNVSTRAVYPPVPLYEKTGLSGVTRGGGTSGGGIGPASIGDLGGSSVEPTFDNSAQGSIEQSIEEEAISGRVSALSQSGFSRRPTFKERFLNRLGQHEASPDEVASRPQVFEQDMHADLMTTRKEDEVRSSVRIAFESLGGFVNTISSYPYRTKSIHISGKVPVRSLEAFRIMMKDFVQDPKYYRESMAVYNRTSDVVVIEDEWKKVEEAIAYLEEALARETDPQKRSSLERQLATHRARLREREKTKEAIIDRVEYADVSLTVQLLPTFWRANSLNDFRQLYVGFNEPTLLDKFKINSTAVALFILHVLSYLFWLIPIVWLWWRKSHRAEPLLDELE